jgi:hypothetical protein
MISGGVALFGHSSHGSSLGLVWPHLNSAAHFLIVENEGEESPLTFMNFLQINFIWH